MRRGEGVILLAALICFGLMFGFGLILAQTGW